ncbi:hypothetical protein CMI48_00145 [Candidatus Pacearchaeota archaeon]|nr:hypothetical protein [Candidatus Pacearchaeota archaeon]
MGIIILQCLGSDSFLHEFFHFLVSLGKILKRVFKRGVNGVYIEEGLKPLMTLCARGEEK